MQDSRQKVFPEIVVLMPEWVHCSGEQSDEAEVSKRREAKGNVKKLIGSDNNREQE